MDYILWGAYLMYLSGFAQGIWEERLHRGASLSKWNQLVGVPLFEYVANWMLRDPADRPYPRKGLAWLKDIIWDGYHGVKTFDFLLLGISSFLFGLGAAQVFGENALNIFVFVGFVITLWALRGAGFVTSYKLIMRA